MKNENEQKSGNIFKKRGTWLNFSMLFFFTATSVVLEILCLQLVKEGFIAKFKGLLTAGLVLLTVLAFIGAIWFYIKGKSSVYKFLISVFILLIFTLAVLLFMLRSGFFDVVQSPEKFAAYLESAGGWMPVAYIVLQFLQVLILPIPSFVSVAAGVALFGAFKTLIYSLLAIVPASIVGFFIGRKLGRKAVVWMIGEDSLEKWQNKLKGKDNLILTAMFLLPLFPDDILCIVAGLSTMSNRYFLIMIVVCRIVNLTGTTFSIDFIPFNTWWGLLIWGALGILFGVLFVFIYKNTDKISEWAKNKFGKKKEENKTENSEN